MDEITKAKRRALHLLEKMDRTEQELRQKLLQNYDETVTEEAVRYVKSFHYIDDLRYARNYVRFKSEHKSRKIIEQELLYRKGIAPELVAQVMEETSDTDEKPLIRAFLRKRHFQEEEHTPEEIMKIKASLFRKGFSYSDVQEVLSEKEHENNMS